MEFFLHTVHNGLYLPDFQRVRSFNCTSKLKRLRDFRLAYIARGDFHPGNGKRREIAFAFQGEDTFPMSRNPLLNNRTITNQLAPRSGFERGREFLLDFERAEKRRANDYQRRDYEPALAFAEKSVKKAGRFYERGWTNSLSF